MASQPTTHEYEGLKRRSSDEQQFGSRQGNPSSPQGGLSDNASPDASGSGASLHHQRSVSVYSQETNPAMRRNSWDGRDERFIPPGKDYHSMPYPQHSQDLADDVEHNAYHYRTHSQLSHSTVGVDDSQRPLVGEKPGYKKFDYADPAAANKPTGIMGKFFSSFRYPIEQRIERKRRGLGVQKYPVVAWTLSVAMVGVCIYELVLNNREQGSPISLKPVVNPMLGPSGSALIHLGARFPPCMKVVSDVPISQSIACMSNVDNPPTQYCPISELCSFGYQSGEVPNQWFRFITAIFLHAGVLHLLFNMFAQLTLSAQIEREMGSAGFLITYFAAGIFGNILGGNFSLVGVPSTGASGAIFGTLGATWVDLFAHWKYQYRPNRKLLFMSIELIIGIAIGFIPYIDNFAHIGGFVMGVLVATVLYPVISETKRHRLIMWGFRLVAAPVAIILFVVLTRNFYTADPYASCGACRYFSCIPMKLNEYCTGTGITTRP